MTEYQLAIGITVAFLGMLLAAGVALIPRAWAHRLSNLLLVTANLIGLVAAVFVITGQEGVVLPAQMQHLFFDMRFTLDRFSAIFFALLSLIGILTSLYAIPYLERYTGTYNLSNVNMLTALFIFGMQGVLLATNVLGFMAFWEIMSITSFFLVVADGTEASRRAGFLYLVMTHLGAGALIAGFFLLTNNSLLIDFNTVLYASSELSPFTLSLALALLLFGFGSKAGLVPFHVWLPEAHPQAPSHVSALMSGVMLKIALYGFLRVILFMVPGVPQWFTTVVVVLGLLSAVFGVLYAILERDIKRILAYSSIENLGLMFVMIGVALLASREGSGELAQAAIFATIYLAIAHALFKTGLFLASGTMISAVHSRSLEVMGGLAQRMPYFSMVVCALALAAAAMPPFGPFIAEWTFMQAMVGALADVTPMLKVTLVVILAILGFVTGLALFAMVKFYALAFLAQPRSSEAKEATEPHLNFLLPSFLAFAGVLLLGLFAPQLFVSLGAMALVSEADVSGLANEVLFVSGEALWPFMILVAMIAVVGMLVLLRRLVTDLKKERVYQTWDCGQPITPRMEYTATAFSAPIRAFFRMVLRAQKVVVATPIVPTNPWMASREMTLEAHSVWYERLYRPLQTGLLKVAGVLSRLQNGSIQFYVGLVLLALIVTIIVAL